MFLLSGILLGLIFLVWMFYKLLIKKERFNDDMMAGIFFLIVICVIIYFVLQI